MPPQTAVFAPDYAPEEIAEIAKKLRVAAGLSEKQSGVVASSNGEPAAGRKPAAGKSAAAGAKKATRS